MRYIYGSLKSRRLGLSLGVNLTPYKICTFNCVYCQLGRTAYITSERKEYIPLEEIIGELKLWFQNNGLEAKELNYITLSGAGEPTLNVKLKELISEIKKLILIPIAVITNASLLSDASVRQALSGADLIIPSLDAATQEVLAKVNRTHPQIKIENIIEGLVSLRKEFRGQIWLEVMLVKGVNDDLRYIKKLKDAIEKIRPDKVQLNSPVRATAEPNILPVDRKKLAKIKDILGEKCEIL